jgi:hypothetical protein
MFDFITKIRRDRWRDQVIKNGERLNQLERSRYGLDTEVFPLEAAYLDALIDKCTRKRDRLLQNLKETA